MRKKDRVAALNGAAARLVETTFHQAQDSNLLPPGKGQFGTRFQLEAAETEFRTLRKDRFRA